MLTRGLWCAVSVCLAFSLVACSGGVAAEEVVDERIGMPASSDDLQGQQVADVVADLEDAGFTNIDAVPMGDLITGWLHEEGEVDQIEVDGDAGFEAGQRFDADTNITVSYHSFPEEDEDEEATQPTVAPAPTPEAEAEPLTTSTSPELAAVLDVADNCGADVADFAAEHEGDVITFDANIAAMTNHGSASTRYDILILAGDYSETSQAGPTFQFRDVNTTFDMQYIGQTPDSIGVGDNLRVTARIEGYEEQSCLLLLRPVSTEFR